MDERQVEEQIERRRERALEEGFIVKRVGAKEVLSDFDVHSASGRTYRVRVRSIAEPASGCSCPDFRSNLLGTCKHAEAVIALLRKKHKGQLKQRAAAETARARIFLSHRREQEIRVTPKGGCDGKLGALLSRFFDGDGTLIGDPIEQFALLSAELELLPGAARKGLIVEDDIAAEMAEASELRGRQKRREWFLEEVRQGRRSVDVISAKLYPYQVEGLLHLALNERALLADDMGLGKTVQAIAAATLLRELRGVQRVLVVTPASLKHQWEREIKRFTSLSVTVIRGAADRRELIYAAPSFFTVVNYELLLRERDVFRKLAPDLVILDEAQRIKNWRTKTSQAVKELSSRYAFVLSGTPLENNLDELYSVMQFLDPKVLGPLWRFNSEFFLLEKRPSGHYKVTGQKNLTALRERIAPVVLRRKRDDVLEDLPERVDNTYFVEMTKEQVEPYKDFEALAKRIAKMAEKRPLTPEEFQRLMMALQKMRLLSDALALHDRKLPDEEVLATAPKLPELRRILEEQVVEAGRKAILFSSFEGMIDLAARYVLKPMNLGFEKLAGSIPTQKRGRLLERFRTEEACRVLISTDAGGVGLNLQEASLVINLDIPWNPAVLEQRIGRAHRMGQKRSVQVVNLVSRAGIEERMLDTLAMKRELFASVFDPETNVDTLTFDRSRGLLARLKLLLSAEPLPPVEALPSSTDGALPAPPEAALPAAGETAVALLDSTALPGRSGEALPSAMAADLAAPSADPAEGLRAIGAVLDGRLNGRLMLFKQWVRPGETEPALLVVLPDDAAASAALIDETLHALWKDGPPPPVHLFDRAAYRSMTALLGSSFEAGGVEGWRSPALPSTAAPADPRPAAARAALEGAKERLRMARLLATNGFAADAFSPLVAALDAGLRGVLTLRAAPEQPLLTDLGTVERLLVRPGHLRSDTGARIAWVRALEPAPDLFEPAVAAVESILDEAGREIETA